MARNKKRFLGDHNLELRNIDPLTHNQLLAFESEKNLIMYGSAGTGKSFISLYLAFDDMLKEQYEKLIIVRSAVPTRDMGFLPGSDKDKAKVFEIPYIDICNDLFHRGDSYEILKLKTIVEFMTTSYIRGLTWNDAVVLVDECQNMTFHELDSIITRVGVNCRIIFCGDFAQSDLKSNGLYDFIKILGNMGEFDMIEFGVNDIVRSDFVKSYLIEKSKYYESRIIQ
jgi:phosphate starvation-inducible protein PhoH and related proteins